MVMGTRIAGYTGVQLVTDRKPPRSRRMEPRRWFVYYDNIWRALRLKSVDSPQGMVRDLGIKCGLVVSAITADEAIEWVKNFKP